MVKAMRELEPEVNFLQLIIDERDEHERPKILYLEGLSYNDDTQEQQQQKQQQQQFAPPPLVAGEILSKGITLEDLAPDVSTEMTIQATLSDDGHPA
jgi:hypothetical protein